ncbi:MAG: dihydropteroate synthase-like protein [Candidatus Bathyarchaeia archaeon]
MRVALVTGQLAKGIVERFSKGCGVESKVIALPIQVASLMNAAYIARRIRDYPLQGFDLILVPGLVKGDLNMVEESAGIPVFKGPKHAADLPLVLNNIRGVKLSKEVPACELLSLELKMRALKAFEEASRRRDLLHRPGNFELHGLPLGVDYPMRVAAEIVDAPTLTDEEIESKAKYYVDSGADIVDVGMMAGGGRVEDAYRAVKSVKRAVKAPVSIDSFDPMEVKAAVEAGVDMVLSASKSNLRRLASIIDGEAVVVVPGEAYAMRQPIERVKQIEKLIEEAGKLGIEKVLADPVLDPPVSPGLMRSLMAYQLFRERNPSTPIFMGLGNVTEMLDADSVGVNALLACLASEVNVSVALTTEVSDKARGSVKELSRAAKMAFTAKLRSSPPKDLGLNLLILKEDRFRDQPYPKGLESRVEVCRASTPKPARMDPRGCFKILLDRSEGTISAIYYGWGSSEPDLIVKGRRAEDIYAKLAELNLISNLRHASYIGYELAKAEMALKLGRSYVQDDDLFTGAA